MFLELTLWWAIFENDVVVSNFFCVCFLFGCLLGFFFWGGVYFCCVFFFVGGGGSGGGGGGEGFASDEAVNNAAMCQVFRK